MKLNQHTIGISHAEVTSSLLQELSAEMIKTSSAKVKLARRYKQDSSYDTSTLLLVFKVFDCSFSPFVVGILTVIRYVGSQGRGLRDICGGYCPSSSLQYSNECTELLSGNNSYSIMLLTFFNK